jgi:uncharacterized protein (TIGR02246 family)
MTTEPVPGAASSGVLREVARRLEDAWNAHDLEGMAAVFTEDAALEDPGAPNGVARGRAAIRAYFTSWLRAFPDAQLHQETLFTPLEGAE